MTDIATIWDVPNSRGDWLFDGVSLLSGNDLSTAVLISLFSDRLANADDTIADGSSDPRGWWADADSSHPIGSRLWLLARAKGTADVLGRAKDYITEALRWLIDDGVAARVDVITEFTTPNMLGCQVIVHRRDGSSVAMNFDWAWKGVN